MIEVENVVPSTLEDNHGASLLGQLMGLPVALQIVDALGLLRFEAVIAVKLATASKLVVVSVVHVALVQMIVSVPVRGTVIGMASARDELTDGGEVVMFAGAVAFQSLHPEDSTSHAQEVLMAAGPCAVPLDQ